MTTGAATQRIVAYHRVSTAEQSSERHVSLETQASKIIAYSHRVGGEMVRTFTDVASGRKDNRPQYQEMLSFVREGHADV
ncbi:MAG: recombinase family protein, partial [Chloroflexi bacterium]|nr:recombinase family protein [Chloroflexota bacterium]